MENTKEVNQCVVDAPVTNNNGVSSLQEVNKKEITKDKENSNTIKYVINASDVFLALFFQTVD